MARELHRKRGGPAGPTNVETRYIWEDVPYGLVFTLALGRIAKVAMPATETLVATAGLIVGEQLLMTNDLIEALGLSTETVQGLLRRVNVGSPYKEALC
ncbi:NAD/NADP octopine/nopaline dehydrogenase, alpha-helical domain [compost metagenome]